MSKITQQVIAKRTGLSRSTVSFVVNDRKDIAIPDETRKRVLSAVKKYGYVHPRAFSYKKTGNIGYLTSQQIKLDEPYYHRFFTGISQGLRDKDFHLLVDNLDPSGCLPDIVRWGKVDGLIVMGSLTTEQVREISKVVPVVLLNSMTEERIVDTVMPDNYGGIRKVVRYLAENGHSLIGFFSLISLHTHYIERKTAFFETAGQLGIQTVPYTIPLPERPEITIDEAAGCVRDYLSQCIKRKIVPSAVVCPNDVCASLFLRIAPSMGLPVPEKLSVFGFDATDLCVHVSPPLCSVNQEMEEMGQQAVRMLLERINGSTLPPREVRLGVELQIRKSVAPYRKFDNKQQPVVTGKGGA